MPRHADTLPLPIDLHPHGGALHRQLYAWFRRSILSGQVGPGQPVPSSRALAGELGVSRGSVVLAYEQLIAEGYLEAVVGSATRVVRSLPPALDPAARGEPARPRLARTARRLSAAAPQPWLQRHGAFRMHTPALSEFPVATWARLLSRHARGLRKADLGYGQALGLPRLREALAAYLGAARGVRCASDRMMVVAGSQQGLDFAARTLLNPGDRIAVEEPGYPGARQAFLAAGLRLSPIPVDTEGLDVVALARLHPAPRAVYVTPSHQYPMGVTMSATRRLQLLQWAARSRAWIFEDDYDSEYRYGSPPLAALQGLDENGRVIYLGTFSKVLYPSLRLGYLVLPASLTSAFAAVRDAADIHPPTLTQCALADFIEQGHFARHLRRMRVHYANLRAALVDELQSRLGDQVELVGAPAGMHLTLLLAAGISDSAIAAAAFARGLSVMPLSYCRLRPRGRRTRDGLVLGFGSLQPVQISAAVAKLASCFGS